MGATEFVTGRKLYEKVVIGGVPKAERFVWIATADLKDMYVDCGRGMEPFLALLARLIERGVAVRLLHAREPGEPFRRDFDRYPVLIDGMERILCPRVHFKCVVVDGRSAYSGSANVTGAGLGAKSERRRNFESGIVTTDPGLIRQIMQQFDDIWMGAKCGDCGRKRFCTDHQVLLPHG